MAASHPANNYGFVMSRVVQEKLNFCIVVLSFSLWFENVFNGRPQMLDESCPECNRLWREYASAAAEHLKLKAQTVMASYDSGLYGIA